MQNEIKGQIERLRSRGATYVDARWYPFEETNQLMMWNGNLKNASSSRESGIGIRVLYQGAWASRPPRTWATWPACSTGHSTMPM